MEPAIVVVGARFTCCDTATDVLPAKLASPLYVAVMECVPDVRPGTVICAELPDMVAVPRAVEPSKNVIVPVADTPAGGWIKADNTTG